MANWFDSQTRPNSAWPASSRFAAFHRLISHRRLVHERYTEVCSVRCGEINTGAHKDDEKKVSRAATFDTRNGDGVANDFQRRVYLVATVARCTVSPLRTVRRFYRISGLGLVNEYTHIPLAHELLWPMG